MTVLSNTTKKMSRRGFLGASALVPAALALQTGEAHAAANTTAQLAAVRSGSPAHQLLYKTDEFFIAHRGAGNISPEHTAYAYAESVRRGALAVEISVRTTRDGKFVCMHDASIKRTTGANLVVRDTNLDELRRHRVDMRENLGDNIGLYDIPTLEEAIEAINNVPEGGEYASIGGKKVVLFIEAKDGPAQQGLLKFITDRGLQRRTVIKMYRDGSGGFNPTSRYLKLVNAAGCGTWCYFDGGDPIDKISAMARHKNVDALGVPFYEKPTGAGYGSMSEDAVRTLTSLGKAVIVWEVHRRSVYEKYKALGVKGFMCPDPYWVIGDPFDSSVKINTGRRQHGILPADPSTAADMPELNGKAIVHRQRYDESVLLGPLSNFTTRDKYTLDFSMKWTGELPKQQSHYGYVAFGRQHDGAFGIGKKFAAKQDDGTYLLAVRPPYQGGPVAQILCFAPGQSTPRVLHTMKLRQKVTTGQALNCKIVVNKNSFYYTINGQYSSPINHSAYRGPYVHFGRFHGTNDGGPLELTRIEARQSWV